MKKEIKVRIHVKNSCIVVKFSEFSSKMALTPSHYKCKFCSHIVAVKTMALHLRIYHATEPLKYSCGEDGCSRIHSTKKGFIKHLAQQHWDNQVPMEIEDDIVISVTNDLTENNQTIKSDTDTLFDSLLAFVLYLYAMPCLPRKIARMIVTKMWALIVVPLTANFLEIVDQTQKTKIQECVNKYTELLKSINTEQKFLNTLAGKGIYVPPKKVTLKTAVSQTHKKGCPKITVVKKTAVMVPISILFKKILESPEVFNKVLFYFYVCFFF
jgi:hypothetical protein